MQLTAHTIILAIAVICLFFAALQVPTPRINLGWLGMALIAAALLFPNA